MRAGFLLLSLLLHTGASAQDFSHDGNRWYEIELSVFSDQFQDPGYEMHDDRRVRLEYLENKTELLPVIGSFMLDFSTIGATPAREEISTMAASPQVFIGPENHPGNNGFRVKDFRKDAFIALGKEYHRFNAVNDTLRAAPQYRLLYHAVWRQPVLSRPQAAAVHVSGGEVLVGGQRELEGSVRASHDGTGRISFEVRLWLIASLQGIPDAAEPRSDGLQDTAYENSREQQRQIPLSPFPAALPPADNSESPPDTVEVRAFMDQARAISSDGLYYLDHPVLGVLLEMRPYQLPLNPGLVLD